MCNCGNGSICTNKSLESEDPISIETHRMSLRLMAKSMPLTASSRIRNMPNRRPRSTSGWLCTTITTCRSGQEWQDLQGRNPDHKLIQFDSSPSRSEVFLWCSAAFFDMRFSPRLNDCLPVPGHSFTEARSNSTQEIVAAFLWKPGGEKTDALSRRQAWCRPNVPSQIRDQHRDQSHLPEEPAEINWVYFSSIRG